MCNVEGPPLKSNRPQVLHSAEPLPIYLDFNATTPVCKEAWNAMMDCKDHWGNPSSTHPYGLDANFIVSEARKQCAQAIGLGDDDSDKCLIFTSGGTEANNLAILGGARAVAQQCRERCAAIPRDVIVASNFEHPAVEEVLRSMETLYRDVWITKRVAVDAQTGVLTADMLRKFLLEGLGVDPHRVALITIMHANNELGSIQPIAELVRVAKDVCGAEVAFHTDAAQSIGKIPVHIADLGVDYLSICSHKFYGPKGVGALAVNPQFVKPLRTTFGAGHEFGIRPGTENIILYRGMAAALQIACRDVQRNSEHLRMCRDALYECIQMELKKKSGMQIFVNGSLDTSLPNTLNIAIGHEPTNTFISAQRLMLELGHIVCMSAGSACHSTLKPGEAIVVSAPLRAVGVNEDRAVGTLRLTCGRTSTVEEMIRAGKFIARRASQQVSDW